MERFERYIRVYFWSAWGRRVSLFQTDEVAKFPLLLN